MRFERKGASGLKVRMEKGAGKQQGRGVCMGGYISQYIH